LRTNASDEQNDDPPAMWGIFVKILIADDDRVLSHMLGAAFRKRGWDVVQAYDTMQAVMFALQAPTPDVILLDIGMPGGTGIKALERLQASVRTAHIPVIVISGASDADTVKTVEGLGAIRFVSKPVDAAAIVALVTEVTGADTAQDH
jgi:DNA-binding response OmpR family regulator